MEENNSSPLIFANENPQPVKKVLGPWATLGFGMVIFIAFVMVAFITVFAFFVIQFAKGNISDLTGLTGYLDGAEGVIVCTAYMAGAVVCLGLTALIIKSRTIGIAEYLGLKRVNWKPLLIWLGVVLGYLLLSEVLGNLLRVPGDSEMVKIYKTAGSPFIFGVMAVIFAPLFEETMFRGFLFEGWRQSKIGLAGTIIITSAIWASSHAPSAFFNIAVIFIGGIIMGIARYKTGSLLTTIIIHSSWNLIATFEMAFLIAK